VGGRMDRWVSGQVDCWMDCVCYTFTEDVDIVN
jgi:hypothetical protein